tara:strand:+ start:433 stop:1152 length:720 start_codon:yes stop_codon:yes gene_type:complete
MKLDDLKFKNKSELVKISEKYKINTKKKSKKQLIEDLLQKHYENQKNKYTQIKQLGKSGKEGTVYLVKYRNKEYALKQFRSHKVDEKIIKEAKMQQICSKKGISPKIKEVNTLCKYIVMEKMDNSLMDIIKKYKGKIPKKYQKEIINIVSKLDNIKIFHGDPNPMNFMFKNNKLYLIDYGFAKEINSNLIQKHGTKTPNKKFMIIGLLLQLKETYGGNFVNCDILRNEISLENRKKLNI